MEDTASQPHQPPALLPPWLQRWVQELSSPECTRTHVNLNKKDIDDEGANALAAAIGTNTSVKKLQLQRNKIRANGATAIAHGLSTSTSLTWLDLRGNMMGDEGAIGMAHGLSTSATLTSLDLGWNNIGTEGATAIAGALSKNTTLALLNLHRNYIGAEGACAIAIASTNVTSLDLGWNNIGAAGATAIADALSTSTTLTLLSLHRNDIGAEGARAIARASTTVTSLDLGWNNIAAVGAVAIADALYTSTTLTSLNLYKNNIDAEGAQAIAQGLSTSGTLTSLNLRMNNIGAEGAMALVGSLSTNTTLTMLDIKSNNICTEGAIAIAGALSMNTSLSSLDVSDNNIGANGEEAIAGAIAANPSLESFDGVKLCTFVALLGVPPEYSDKSNKVILGYLRDSSSGTCESRRMKLVLVGPGSAGKTTLVERLVHGRFNPYVVTTDGISVSVDDWVHCGVRYHLWDFGGQPIYANTHSIFYTTNCAFLLVWNPRAEVQSHVTERMLQDYLRMIRFFVPNASVILVSTHQDEWPNMPPVDMNLPHFHVSSMDGTNIESLAKGISEVTKTFEHVKQKIPIQYARFEENLLALKPVNDQNSFFYVPKSVALDLAEEFQMPLDTAERALQLFHDWGSVYRLSDDAIVLTPQRLADVFARIVSFNPHPALLKSAVLLLTDMSDVWKDFPSELHASLWELIHACELALPLHNCFGPFDVSLIPCMLPNSESEEFRRLAEPEEGMVSIKFSFEYLPQDVFPRLLVRSQHRTMHIEHWYARGGIFKSLQEDSSKLVMQVTPNFDCITFTGYSGDVNGLLTAIRALKCLLDDSYKHYHCVDYEMSCLCVKRRKWSKDELEFGEISDREVLCERCKKRHDLGWIDVFEGVGVKGPDTTTELIQASDTTDCGATEEKSSLQPESDLREFAIEIAPDTSKFLNMCVAFAQNTNQVLSALGHDTLRAVWMICRNTAGNFVVTPISFSQNDLGLCAVEGLTRSILHCKHFLTEQPRLTKCNNWILEALRVCRVRCPLLNGAWVRALSGLDLQDLTLDDVKYLEQAEKDYFCSVFDLRIGQVWMAKKLTYIDLIVRVNTEQQVQTQLLQNMDIRLRAIDTMERALTQNELDIPTLFVVQKFIDTTPRRTSILGGFVDDFKKFSGAVRGLWRTSFEVRFVCPVMPETGLHGHGYKFGKDKEWFQQVAPALRFGTKVVLIAAGAYASCIGAAGVAGGAASIFGSINKSALEGALSDLSSQMTGEMTSYVDGLANGNTIPELEGQCGALGESYSALKALLHQCDPYGLNYGLVKCTAENGDTAWVCREAVDKFMRLGKQAFA